MSTSLPPRPRKRLPVNPSIEHLKKQAKRRVKADGSVSLSESAGPALVRRLACFLRCSIEGLTGSRLRGRGGSGVDMMNLFLCASCPLLPAGNGSKILATTAKGGLNPSRGRDAPCGTLGTTYTR